MTKQEQEIKEMLTAVLEGLDKLEEKEEPPTVKQLKAEIDALTYRIIWLEAKTDGWYYPPITEPYYPLNDILEYIRENK